MAHFSALPQIPASPSTWSQLWGERVAAVVKQLVSRQNATDDITLDPVADNTTLTDFRIHPECVLAFMPQTAAAAAAAPTIYVPAATIGKGQAVIMHAPLGGAGQDFQYAVIG